MELVEGETLAQRLANGGAAHGGRGWNALSRRMVSGWRCPPSRPAPRRQPPQRRLVTWDRHEDQTVGWTAEVSDEHHRAGGLADSHTFFDTAEVYGPFTNEELVGEALAPFRAVPRPGGDHTTASEASPARATVRQAAYPFGGHERTGFDTVLVAKVVAIPDAAPNPFVRKRVQNPLPFATRDERILARTGGDYLKFCAQPARLPRDIVEPWRKR